MKFDQAVFLSAVGTIDARATAAEPIIFTTVKDDSVGEDLTEGVDGVPEPGHWESIYVSSDSAFEHVEVRYAGNTRSPGNGFGFVPAVRSSASASFENVAILESNNVGIALTSGSPTLRSVNIVGAASHAITQALDVSPEYDGIRWSNNVLGNHIRLDGGVLTEDRTWDFDGLPVHLTGDVTISQDADGNLATLTIVPGSIIKMPTGRFISANPGVLKAEGTARATDCLHVHQRRYGWR